MSALFWLPFFPALLQEIHFWPVMAAVALTLCAWLHAREEVRDGLAEDLGRITGSRLVLRAPAGVLACPPACLAAWCAWTPLVVPESSHVWLSVLVGLWLGDATLTHWRHLWAAGFWTALLLLCGALLVAAWLCGQGLFCWLPAVCGAVPFAVLQPIMRRLK